MTENVSLRLDTSGLSDGLRAAGDEINRSVQEDILPAADLISDAFSGAARSVESEFGKAARNGALSFKGLTRAIAQDLRSIAVDALVRKPVQGLVQSLFSSFGGARANGGGVSAGNAYLVGERGPEVFTPGVSGRVSPSGGPGRGVTINLNISGVQDADSFRRSQTQIAAALSRAVARGQRNQ